MKKNLSTLIVTKIEEQPNVFGGYWENFTPYDLHLFIGDKLKGNRHIEALQILFEELFIVIECREKVVYPRRTPEEYNEVNGQVIGIKKVILKLGVEENTFQAILKEACICFGGWNL